MSARALPLLVLSCLTAFADTRVGNSTLAMPVAAPQSDIAVETAFALSFSRPLCLRTPVGDTQRLYNVRINNSTNYQRLSRWHDPNITDTVAAISLPLQMAQAGYRTASIGKYHVAPEAVFHFDEYLPGPGGNPVVMAENCKALFEKKDKPFFLYFCTNNPHRGGGPDKTFPGKHKPDLFGNKPNKGSHKGVTEVFYDPADVIVPDFLPDTPESRAELAQYYQSCSRVDLGLGHLIANLKASGHWANTVIIFTDDPWIMKWRYE